MDGENNGKPYENRWFGGVFPTIFGFPSKSHPSFPEKNNLPNIFKMWNHQPVIHPFQKKTPGDVPSTRIDPSEDSRNRKNEVPIVHASMGDLGIVSSRLGQHDSNGGLGGSSHLENLLQKETPSKLTWQCWKITILGGDIFSSRRWQLKYFVIFTPNPGEMIQIDEHIFQLGWNHQLEGGRPSH